MMGNMVAPGVQATQPTALCADCLMQRFSNFSKKQTGTRNLQKGDKTIHCIDMLFVGICNSLCNWTLLYNKCNNLLRYDCVSSTKTQRWQIWKKLKSIVRIQKNIVVVQMVQLKCILDTRSVNSGIPRKSRFGCTTISRTFSNWG